LENLTVKALASSVTGKFAIVDFSGPWMISLIAASSHGIPYFYAEYMAARYNFFKENEFAPIINLEKK
jgi:hypothetical protein